VPVTTRIHLAGMCCPSEEGLVRKQLQSVAGLGDVRFDFLAKTIEVEHALPGVEPLLQALNQAGLGAKLVQEQAAGAPARWITPTLGAALLAGAASEGVAMTTGAESSPPVVVLALLSMLLVGSAPWSRAWGSLRQGQFGINALMIIAVVGAVALGQWPEAAMVLALFSWSELLEAYSIGRVSGALQELLHSAPETAELQVAGAWKSVPVGQVAVGDLVRVRPGERVPLDGVIEEGASALNQAALTGESLPVDKSVGESVWAGSLNESGALVLRVTQAQGNRQLDRVVEAVRRAQQEKAPIQSFIDRFARVYTPLVLLCAVLLGGVPWLLGWEQAWLWTYRALVLLVVSCPCALVLSTPVTLVSGLTAAARRGVLVKSARALEEAARLQVIALDKTGTLTQGRPTLSSVRWLDNDTARLLRISASLQEASTHPLARAVMEYWRESGIGPELLPMQDWQQAVGRGVSGRSEGSLWQIVAHRHWKASAHPELVAQLQQWEAQGSSTAVLLEDDQPRALFGFSDPLRNEAHDAVHELSGLGLDTLMLSGDGQAAASSVASRVGISRVAAQLLPEDKLARIDDELRAGRHVAMVGDGLNDAPALARASLGIAIGHGGSGTAIEVGDVVLMQNDLRRLPEFVALARRTRRRLHENIALSLGTKFLFLALALAGKATLWMAVLADVGACLVVVANGLRLLRTPPAVALKSASKCCSGGGCAL
jgi:Zn2+/Cd2+-exporting ATPase